MTIIIIIIVAISIVIIIIIIIIIIYYFRMAGARNPLAQHCYGNPLDLVTLGNLL